MKFFKNFEVDLKVLVLSELITPGGTLFEHNLTKQFKNIGVDKSRCRALVTQQEN